MIQLFKRVTQLLHHWSLPDKMCLHFLLQYQSLTVFLGICVLSLVIGSIEPISGTVQDLLFHWQTCWLSPLHANNPLNTLFTLPVQIDPLLRHMRAVIHFAPFNNAIKLYCAMKRLHSQPLVAVQETKCAVICTTLSPLLHFTVNIMTQCGGQLNSPGLDASSINPQ